MGVVMKYATAGLILFIVACAIVVDSVPVAHTLLTCAGINQVYYDRARNTWFESHPEVDVYYREVLTLQADADTLNSLAIQEGIYKSRILNDRELSAQVKRCESLISKG